MKILFWVSGLEAPSPRFRFLQYVEPLKKLGHTVDVVVANPPRNWAPKSKNKFVARLEQYYTFYKRIRQVKRDLANAANYDVVFTNKDLVPYHRVKNLEPWLAKLNPNLIFDIDDAIYLGKRGLKMAEILPHYKAVIGGNPTITDYCAKTYHVAGFYIPMGINMDFYKPAKSRLPGKLRIGWSGSHHTNVFALPLLKNPLLELAKKIDFEFLIISNKNPDLDWQGIDFRYLPWTESTEVECLQLMDIGLMPLADGPFERGKCALKAVQYMAVGIPALVSPVGVNELIIDDGVNGFHCRTENDFVEKLFVLANDEDLRAEMGKNAYQKVKVNYSIEVLTKEYERVFKEVAGIKALDKK